MKKLPFILLLLLASQMVNAQAAKYFSNQLTRHHLFLFSLLQKNPHATIAYKIITKERLSAQSIYDNTHIPAQLTDSVRLTYDSAGTSQYDYNMMFYSFNYPYSTTPLFNYDGYFTKPQVLYDTLLHWGIDPDSLIFKFYEAYYNKYDSDNNLTSSKYVNIDSSLNPEMDFKNYFNKARNITKDFWFSVIAGIADSTYKQTFIYDTSNKLTSDSLYSYNGKSWNISAHSVYKYNASDDLIQINSYYDSATTFLEELQYINTYDTFHHLLTVQVSQYDGRALIPYVKDTFAYTPGIYYHTAWREYQYDGINKKWIGVSNMIKHVNTLDLPDTVYIETPDTFKVWQPQTMYVMKYDTLDNPIRLSDYEYVSKGAYALAGITNYYYMHQFDTVVTVRNQQMPLNKIKVYPDPATDYITIDLTNQNLYKSLSILLINMNGQIIRSLYEPHASTVKLSLNNIANAPYLLFIADENGNVLYKQIIIKQ